MSAEAMNPDDTWALTAEFDKLCARLFAIANKQGVLLSVRIRRPRAKKKAAKK